MPLLPAEFANLKPKLNKSEIKLVLEEKYSLRDIIDRRMKIENDRTERLERMREARISMSFRERPRSLADVPAEELAKIEEEFVEREVGDTVKVKTLAETYNIFPAALEKHAQQKRWQQKREAWQVKVNAARGKRNTPAALAAEAGTQIITQADKEAEESLLQFKDQSRGDKAAQRSIQLMRLRSKTAKALRITDADWKIYKNNPRQIISEIDNMIADPVQAKNWSLMVQTFKSIVELEREEDGWVKGRGIGGGLEQDREADDEHLSVILPDMDDEQPAISGEVMDDNIFTDSA